MSRHRAALLDWLLLVAVTGVAAVVALGPPAASAAPADPASPVSPVSPSGSAAPSRTPAATGSASATAGPTPTVTPTPTPTPSAQDVAFLRAAHQDNLAEVRAGTAAEHRGNSSALRNLGARLVREHTSLDTDLQRIATRFGLDMPLAPTAARRAELAKVSAHTGAAFDRAWVDTVTGWNIQSLSDDQTESRAGTLKDIRNLARDAVSVARGHLSRLAKVPLDSPVTPTPVRTRTDDYAASQSPLVIGVAAGMIGLGLALVAVTVRAALWYRRRPSGG